MDGIHDMGGMQGWGKVQYDPDEPAFTAPWQGRAFAISLLSMNRLTGQNLDAMRHALERLTPLQYLQNGYYGRWLLLSETLLTDSGVIAEGAVEARARKLRGEDVAEPPDPVLNKPEYQPTGPGSLRQIDEPPRFKVGQQVRAKDIHPAGHTRLPRYVRGRVGTVERILPAAVLPDTNAHFLGENAQHCYQVAFDSQTLWGDEAEDFVLHVDLFDSYLEPAPVEVGS
ncbi:MAG TPA: nitrile hydratase subunit beta [Acidimicrobiia bacterium]|nr:nitrile hydratase subunit beta [Acidimicrobiia bacterium]